MKGTGFYRLTYTYICMCECEKERESVCVCLGRCQRGSLWDSLNSLIIYCLRAASLNGRVAL